MATVKRLNPGADVVPATVASLRKSFLEHPIKSIGTLENELSAIHKALSKDRELLAKGLWEDFHRSFQETFMLEYECAMDDIEYLRRHLTSLLSPDGVDEKSSLYSTINAKVEKIPYGTVLIVVPFNYPLILSMDPLIGALASGNNVVLKLPYDKCPKFCLQLTKTLLSAVDPSRLAIFNGGIPESAALLDQHFDKILFTGSGRTGRLVMEKAAKNITPVVLELGGKSPTFLTSHCSNLRKAVRRILWGKFTNAGQTCVAPDYLLVEDKIYDEAIDMIKQVYHELYPVMNPEVDFTHLVDGKAFNRVSGYLATTDGKLVVGGDSDSSTNYIAPTVVSDVTFADSLMQEELFGPVLPVIRYSDLIEAVNSIRGTRLDTPLAVYIFSDSSREQGIVRTIRSGGLCINETLMHAGCHTTPFGGIGNSGCGNYHGKYSIRTFTHERVVMKQPYWAESLISIRYPPYTFSKINASLRLSKIPPMPVITFWGSFFYIAVLAIGFVIGWYAKK